MTHEYNSPEYFAQQFRDFLIDTKYKKDRVGKVGIRAKQSGNRVDFNLANLEASVIFDICDEQFYAMFQISGRNEDRVKMNVKRSRKGRLSGTYYIDFFRQEVMPRLFPRQETASEDKGLGRRRA